jgi:hypothetical protein
MNTEPNSDKLETYLRSGYSSNLIKGVAIHDSQLIG